VLRVGARFLLVTTVACEEVGGVDLARFLTSLATQAVEIELHLVIRGQIDRPGAVESRRCWDGSLILHHAPPATGLSRARNIAVSHVLADDSLERASVVAFPDDDCWYPPGLLASVADRIVGWDVLMGSYSDSPPAPDHQRFPPTPGELDWRQAYEQTASVTQFYTAAAIRKVGLFDERFGVGARFPSGEDADYLVRAIHLRSRCLYDPSLVVGHRRMTARDDRHFIGGTVLLAKHAREVTVARRLLVRRLLAGAKRTATGGMSLGTYAGTLRAVTTTLGR
jgi:glycosyltransferase involved in cell wall biosynthesis